MNGASHGLTPTLAGRGHFRFAGAFPCKGIVLIVGGILPLVYLAVRMVANRNRPGEVPPEESVEQLRNTA